MKILAIAILLAGCATKYQDYPHISKKDFELDGNKVVDNTPHEAPKNLLKGRAETEEFCESQILFNKNAHVITTNSLPALVRQSCPGSDYLLDATVTYNWWTVLVYSRSCVKVESFCPKRRN
ncbi:MAG: hypothetical protein CME67_05140 [Halobacteriovoraceae bacterium]|nr:hypothetical protein [Halobacteriovoraceae bacterium]|tara:strand:+ start:1200 stop:1565 length:366 start_codon:yes stop_codon:yes gene_type:complete